MTPSEAVDAMEKTIRAYQLSGQEMPEGFGFFVSKEIANGLLKYMKMVSGREDLKDLDLGDKFTWRGFKCVVA